MTAPKVAVIYYSSTGNTARMAEAVAEGARAVGAEVRVLPVEELAPESAIAQNPAWKAHYEKVKDLPKASLADLEWADAIILGTPSRFGNVASQLKQFIDTTGGLWAQGKLANKVVAGFVTASNDHGGQEATLLALYHVFYHWGAIVAAPGYTDPVVFSAGGNPYGASATSTEQGVSEQALEAARHLGKRVATVAGWVLAGRGAQ
ncbi:MAG TPA: NAD(P)H:quinone oxidoreductase [Symbiobacteriaceae bacterium]